MTADAHFDFLREVAAALDALPQVARRSAGPLGVVVSYLPGERLAGVKVADDRMELRIVLRWGYTVEELERSVIDALPPSSRDYAIDLVIDDLALPDESEPDDDGHLEREALPVPEAPVP